MNVELGTKSQVALAWLCCEPLPAVPITSGCDLRIGREEGCDLVLRHTEVSRHHASVRAHDREMFLEDRGSANGCYVNGTRRTKHFLAVGDVILIGPYEVEVRESPEARVKPRTSTRRALVTSNASMAGQLSDVSLVEVLQGLAFNERTCTLTVTDGSTQGQIVLARGRVRSATLGAKLGLEAIRGMVTLKHGTFVITNSGEPIEPTLDLNVTSLLLELSRELDEVGHERTTVIAVPASLVEKPPGEKAADEPARVVKRPPTSALEPASVPPPVAATPRAPASGSPIPVALAACAFVVVALGLGAWTLKPATTPASEREARVAVAPSPSAPSPSPSPTAPIEPVPAPPTPARVESASPVSAPIAPVAPVTSTPAPAAPPVVAEVAKAPPPEPVAQPSPSPPPRPKAPVAVADLPSDEKVWDGHKWRRTPAGHHHGPTCGHVFDGRRWKTDASDPREYPFATDELRARPDAGLYDYDGKIWWIRDHVHGPDCFHKQRPDGLWYLPD